MRKPIKSTRDIKKFGRACSRLFIMCQRIMKLLNNVCFDQDDVSTGGM